MTSLKKVAVVGAVVALGGAGLFQWRIQANFRRQPFYMESLRLLHGYQPALKLLGEPIRTKNLDLGDTEKTWTDGLNARLAIPLKGPLAKATLHSWASRKSVKDQWLVDKMDFEINNRCWTFYINPNTKESQSLSYESSEDTLQIPRQKIISDNAPSGQFLYLNPTRE